MSQTANGQPQPHDDNWIPACFGPNQMKLRPLDPAEYGGKHIAWSWDGTSIVAKADTYPELKEKVKALGIRPDRVVYDYVDPIWEPAA